MDLNLWKLGNQGLNILFVPKGRLLIQVPFFFNFRFSCLAIRALYCSSRISSWVIFLLFFLLWEFAFWTLTTLTSWGFGSSSTASCSCSNKLLLTSPVVGTCPAASVGRLASGPKKLKCPSPNITGINNNLLFQLINAISQGGGGGTPYNGLYGGLRPKGVPFSAGFRHMKG